MLNKKLESVAGIEFIKGWWDKLGMSGMVTPTLSTEELDKKITDLKTVESWLTFNTNILKSTIQALEVQRATIATLHTFNDSLNTAPKATGSKTNTDSSTLSPDAWWTFLQNQFKQAADAALHTDLTTTQSAQANVDNAPKKSRARKKTRNDASGV